MARSRLAESALLRLGQLDLARLATREITVESLAMTVATEAENFTDKVLEKLIDTSVVRGSKFGNELIKEIGSKFYSSWPERKRWLKSFACWVDPGIEEQLLAVIDMRNAIAHGSGRLTRLQTGNMQKQLALESSLQRILLVTVDGKRLHPSDESPERIMKIGVMYVKDLDERSCNQRRELLDRE